ncbi:hypothetical protein SDC9_176185 [bioreactor metagenome]|uniref:Uncharacterized protein n=1 Tax=bioreactor metagenome TaxID=1076179 RepID=A0A645GR79_9ZZZZ
MFFRVKIQHEIQQGAFDFRPQPLQYRKTTLRESCAPLKIHDSERFSDFPVRLRLERERRNFSPFTDFDVIVFVPANGARFVGTVRNPQKQIIKRRVNFGDTGVDCLDAFTDDAHLFHEARGIFSGRSGLADLPGSLIALRLQLLGFNKERSFLSVKRQKRIDIHVVVAVCKKTLRFFDIASYPSDVKHVLSPSLHGTP